jgi:single-strand DNA-binding protein
MSQLEPKINGDFRLTKDPVLRYTAGGTPVASLRLAGQRYVGKKEVEGKTEYMFEPIFISMTAWKQRAERIANTLHKGDLVSVEAILNMRHWQEQGKPHETTVLEGIIDKCILRSKAKVRTESTEAASTEASQDDISEGLPPLSEEIPFGQE